MNEMVTYYRSFKDAGEDIPLENIFSRIKSDFYKDLAEKTRELKRVKGKDSDEYKKFKTYNIPFFTGSGTFERRANEGMKEHNGLIIVDFDDLDDPAEAKDVLIKDRFTYACFHSISGNLAVVVKINPKLHHKSFDAIKNYYLAQYGFVMDYLADYARIRFVSHDPEIFINEEAEVFTPSKGIVIKYDQGPIPEFFTEQEQIEYAERLANKTHSFEKGQRHNYLFMVAVYANKLGVPVESIDAHCRLKYPHYAQNASHCNAIRGTYSAYTKEFGSWVKPKQAPVLNGVHAANGNGQYIVSPNGIQQAIALPTLSPFDEAKQKDPLKNTGVFAGTDDSNNLKGVRITFRTEVPYTPAIVTLNGVDILSSGNISGIIAQPGQGKSQTCEAIVSAHLNPDCDSLGFKVDIRQGSKILYIDGERTIKDCKRGLQRIGRRAQDGGDGTDIIGEDSGLRDLIYESYIQIPFVEARRAALQELIEENDVGLLLLDGIGEFCADPNDQNEVSKVRMWLVALANAHDFGIVTTLHSNPGSEKPRGHLGSELCRVAEAVYILKREEMDREIRKLTTDFEFSKTRNDTDLNEVRFKWEDEYSMFRSTDYVHPVKSNIDYSTRFSLCLPVGKSYDKGVTYSQIKRTYMRQYKVSDSSFKRHLDRAIELQCVLKITHELDPNKHVYMFNPVEADRAINQNNVI